MNPETGIAASPEHADPAPRFPARKAALRCDPWQWRLPDTREQQILRVSTARNPLLEAARTLLRALAEMPVQLPGTAPPECKCDAQPDAAQVASIALALRHLLIDEVERFQQLCDRANIRQSHAAAASYLLCTALDEAAHGRPWGQDGWPQYGLLVSLHQDTAGGARCFQLLDRLLASAVEHHDLIEVFYQVLSLGFAGKYAGVADGHRELDATLRRLLGLLAGRHGDIPRELSPHWRGEATRKPAVFRTIPIWMMAAVLGFVAAALFGWFKYQLLEATADTEQQVLSIGNLNPPGRPMAPGLREWLAADIDGGVVSVQDDEVRSVITFRGDDMFASGRSDIRSHVLPLLGRVAGGLSRVPGQVTVVGHSDNIPVRGARFSSNQTLSEARALTVGEYLASHGVTAGRLQAMGKGDTEPLASNRTMADRARNRRVEIIVTYGARTGS
nr:type VI secretion system protein TssL, long form [uncultured Cupriavidus sp.]